MSTGWIKLQRSILKWEWYDDANTFRLFVHLLLTANHDNNKWRGHLVERGQRIASYASLSKETGLTPKQVRVSIGKLKETGELAHEGASKFSVITICKYDTYQCNENEKGKQSGSEKADQKAVRGQAEGNQRATNKNDKNIKNEKKSESAKARADSLEEIILYCLELDLMPVDAEYLWDHWNANGWRNGTKLIKDWKATTRNWKRFGYLPSQKNPELRKEGSNSPTPRPLLPPHNWRSATLEYFKRNDMQAAITRMENGTGFQRWEDLDAVDQTEVREIAHQIEKKASK